jgi:predicted transposase/invertase (TIGR01784 family)
MAENIDDKGYRRILSDKRTFLDFVKHHIAAPWTEQIDENDLELVDGRFVTEDFRDKETDIIYKAKIGGQDTIFYVLLELQSRVDFTIPFRLLMYMVNLLSRLFASADSETRELKQFRLPAVVPIVLYNGPWKWSCVRSFKEYLAGYELFAPNIIDFEYIMIDINDPDETELIKIPTLMNLAMLADRKGGADDVLRRLRTVLKISARLTPDEQLQLKDWIVDVIFRKAKDKLNEDEVEDIRKSLQGKDVENMTYAIERAIDEVELRGELRGKLEGKLEGKMETAGLMIKKGFPLEVASECSGISVDELKERFGSGVLDS